MPARFYKSTLYLLLLVTLLSGGGLLALPTARAQFIAHAWTTSQTPVRRAATAESETITLLEDGAALMLEGRTADGTWVLGHTVNYEVRGWIASQTLALVDSFRVEQLPYSGEVLAPVAPQQPAAPILASGPLAQPISNLNVRTGPDTTFDDLGVVPRSVDFVLEGRNRGGSWVFGHTADGALRGWVITRYMRTGGLDVMTLPQVDEAGGSSQATNNAAPGAALTGTALAVVQQPMVTPSPTPNLDDWPRRTDRIELTFSQEVLENARGIYRHGQSFGNVANSFIMVGDSTTAGNQFTLPLFHPFTYGYYDLGQYPELQETIDFFRGANSFGAESQTSRSGQATADELDPLMADPTVCAPGETPLACEIRMKRPSVAIIYIGFVELAFSTQEEYLQDLNMILETCVSNGVIPVLTTLTAAQTAVDRHATTEKYILMNEFIRGFANSYKVPLIDLQELAMSLPNNGTIWEEGVHLSFRIDGAVSFNGDEWLYGKDLRTLLTLQALDTLRQEVLTP